MKLEERITQLEKQKEELQAENIKLKSKINELEGTLSSAQDINDNHQRYNGKLQIRVTEVESDNKKLSHQIEDIKMNHMRKSGM
jgi:predicted RNase H-like nuclease (RuvC/YqgF family)